jgi:predicted nucleotidyltransferase
VKRHGLALPAESTELLRRLLEGQRLALGDRLVATYVFGSAASGDFEAGLSDLDTVAVLADDPTPNDLAVLARMHSELVRQSPEWDDRVEAVYLSAAALASFRYGRHPAARVSPGEPFHAIEVDRRWVLDWYRVREIGVTLHGPPPHKLIPKILNSEFVAAARGELLIWPRQISPGMSAGSLAYAVLTICRSLCLIETGRQVSKRVGADWGATRMPEFAQLISEALTSREVATEGGATGSCLAFADVRRFAVEAASRIRDG